MEHVGKRVKKDFPGKPPISGSIEAYEPGTGSFRIAYDGGDSEDLKLPDVSKLLVIGDPSMPKRRRIGSEGTISDNSVVISTEFDLNLTEGDDTSVDEVRGRGKISSLDLNLNQGMDLDRDDKERECGVEGLKKGVIDLNLDVNEDLSVEREGRCFDLNLEVEEVRGEAGDEVVEVDEKGNLVNGKVNLDNKVESVVGDVADEKSTPVFTQMRTRGRKRKDAMNNIAELGTPESKKAEFGNGGIGLDLGNGDETPLETDHGVSGSAQRGRRGRPKREESIITSPPTPGTGLRRSIRRAKMASVSDQDQGCNAAALDGINDKLSSPATSVMSEEKVTGARRGKSTVRGSLPPKVELPPSSCDLDIRGVSVFDLVSVYAFLRSFSTLLFLSPFELGAFVASVKCNDSTSLFDSIHVSLLRTLRKHLESLSSEGSASASDCLRSLNWDFLDLITWPMFLVEYLLLHSPGYIPGLDLCQLKLYQRDYYKMPVSSKVEILRHLCDNVVELEHFRLEVNRRTGVPGLYPGLERNVKSESSRKRKSMIDVASNSCITEEHAAERADGNSDECCLCKMDGNLICCDGCPAAFHSRCVGVVSSLLPEGDWYCPECAIEKDKPWMQVEKSVRGAALLGVDPYGRQYYSSCGYLLVLESCNDAYSFWSYNRDDLPTLVESLESSPFIYKTILSAISKHWSLVRGVGGTRNDLDTRSYSIQSDFPEKAQLKDNMDFNNAEYVTRVLETGNNGVKMENHLASSEGSGEVSQTFVKTATLNVKKGENLNSGNCSYDPCSINSGEMMSQVHSGIRYVNCYEFARTASSVYQEWTHRSLDKTSGDAPKSIEAIVGWQLKIVWNRFAKFSWSNIQNSDVNSEKENCGWCFYCRVPEEGRECLCIMNDRVPAVQNFTCGGLGIKSINNRKNHLIDLMCHIICIEDHLQGLLLGPWLNPYYSALWRKNVVEAAEFYSLKNLLLKLESNLHPLAISSDWRKHVDTVATIGSASHIISNAARASMRNGFGRKKANSSAKEITPSSKAASGLSLFWWRGGRASRELFNWKVLPRSFASKAARQGGRKKIPGILYPDSGEAKRTKYASWRAAVETSRSVEQLALLVRELDANIRWDDIGNTNSISVMDKESIKSMRSFKKAIIRRKCSEGAVVRYLLDFGKRRFIPNVVAKHGSKLEESSSEKKKYWLEESHVPLHLLKAFEEKRISRKSKKMKPAKLLESSRAVGKSCKEKGFAYLFSRAERLENCQCGHCHKDVLIREAVSCQYCKGFFHKRHAKKSAGSISSECTYSCQKCQGGKFGKTDARKGISESPKLKNASKKLTPLGTGKGKKRGRPKKQAIAKKGKRVPLVVVPLRRSARNAERVSKPSLQKTKVKKRKKGKQANSGKQKLRKLNNGSRHKKRTTVYHNYWLNGLQLSRMPSNEKVMHFRSRMLLVLSGQATFNSDKPKCSLCCELQFNPELNYVACEICRSWFHGDALNLGADKIGNLIGFKCHKCLNKRLPACPHHCPTGNNNVAIVSDNKAEAECIHKDSNGLTCSDDRSADLKSQSIDKVKDICLTVELGEVKSNVPSAVEIESIIPNSDMIGEDQYSP